MRDAFDRFTDAAEIAAQALLALNGNDHGKAAMVCFTALRYLEYRHKRSASVADWETYSAAKAQLSGILDRTDQRTALGENTEAS